MEKLFAISRRIYENRSIGAIRKGLLYLFPLIIIASFSTFLVYFPSDTYSNFMARVFGAAWQKFLADIYAVSMGIISIALTVTISYSIAAAGRTGENGRLSPPIPCIVSLMCYFSLAWSKGEDIQTFFMSNEGIFVALLSGVFATKLFLSLYSSMQRKFGHTALDSDPVLSQAVLSILPACFVLLLASLLENAILLLGFKNANDATFRCFFTIVDNTGNFFFRLVLVILMIQFMWFFGIHGNLALSEVLSGVLNTSRDMGMGIIDREAYTAAGKEDLLRTFIDVFVLMGGAGTTICLLAAIFIISRRTNTIKLAKISLLPAVFNINEILIFGLPIVLNPMYLIPFFITPVAVMIISYLAITAGLVPGISSMVAWTTPPLLSGYLACGSLKGIGLQLFNMAVGTLIYLPFVRANEREISRELESTYSELRRIVENRAYGTRLSLLDRNDAVGYLAGLLSKDIKAAIKRNEFALEYQPLINNNAEVEGVEALLRWRHERFGPIPPVIVTAIAEEAESMNELGQWVIRNACMQLARWKAEGLNGISMSVNISPTQLQYDGFAKELINCIDEYGIEAGDIELEITESVVLELDSRTRENVERLLSKGFKLAMDDFGMGYTSLLYIRHFNIDTIKIDGSIIRNILLDKSCQDIVSSMVYLCRTLNIKVIAEYVEETGQYELLKLLGCSEYQGYLFSPPLPSDAAVQYISEMNSAIMPCSQ